MQNRSIILLCCVVCVALYASQSLGVSLAQAADAPRTSSKKTSAVRTLRMDEAVRIALRDNPSVAAASAGSQASEEGRKAARGAFGPRLGTSYSVSKVRQETSPRAVQRLPEYGTYTWNIDVSQPVFSAALIPAYQKASLQAQSGISALRNTEISLVGQVQTVFLSYLRAGENARSAADSLARLRDQLKITQAFYQVGLRPRLDVLQAEVDVSQSENLLIQSENARDTAKAQLNTLLGMSATADVEYVGELRHVPFTRGLEACLDLAYRQRPDLDIAQKSVAIADKDKKIIQADYLPKIDAYYNISQYGNTFDLRRAGAHDSRGTRWEVGMQATWNVFSWGTTYFQAQQADFSMIRMRHEENNLRLGVGYDVKSKLLALQEAEKRIAVAEKGLEQAQEAYNVALARYQAQVGTNFDVLDASAKLTAAQAALTSARADYLTALSSLYVAMGELQPDLMSSR